MLFRSHGSEKIFKITPETGFKVKDVMVDGVSAGSVPEYKFSNITRGHSISVTFEVITYTISGSAGTGGAISPHGQVTVDYGTDFTFIISPDEGYMVSEIKINNNRVGKASEYTFTNVTSDNSIYVVFALLQTYQINAVTGIGGTIDPPGSKTVIEGTDHVYRIIPDFNYRIEEVIVDNKKLGAVSEYIFEDVTKDHNITVIFATDIKVKMYPNPFSDIFNVDIATPGNGLFDLYVYDLTERLVYKRTKIPGNSITPVTFNAAQGIYIVRVFKGDQRVATFRMIKK